MKPLISIGTLTIRDGGLDWQLKQLANQTFKSFEWIVVDAFYEKRKTIMSKLAKEYGIHLIHLPEPILKYKTNRNIATNHNEILKHVSTDYYISMEDWHVVPDNFVEYHLIYLKQGYAACFRCIFTDLMDELPYNEYSIKAASIELGITAEELFSQHKALGHPDSLITIDVVNRELLDKANDHRVIQLRQMHPEADILSRVWQITSGWWWPNASSILSKYIIDSVGGFDESFNGGTGGEDSDLALRMERAGAKFIFDPKIIVFHINHWNRDKIKTIERNDGQCIDHPREKFRFENCGNVNAKEIDNITPIVDDGVVYLKCKKCGWNGSAHGYDLLNRNKRRQVLYPPIESAGLYRRDLIRERKELFDSGYTHKSKCICCENQHE